MSASEFFRVSPDGPRKVRRRVLLVAALALVVFVLPTPSSHAETFDLHIRSFCSPASNCGASSEQAYYDNLIDMTHELNVQWRQHGISFRPVIFPIDSSNPNEYAITGCGVDDPNNPFSCSNDYNDFCVDDSGCSNGGTCEPTKFCEDMQTRCASNFECAINNNGTACLPRNAQQRRQLRKTHSDPNREVVTILLVQQANWCCSNPPSVGDSDESISAIVCDGRRNVKASGSVWSHEMGHYFCLRHTFTGAEFADNGSIPNHDGDPPFGVFDTPDDPQRVEGEDLDRRCSVSTSTRCSRDSDCPGSQTCLQNVFVEGHEFCMTTSESNTDDGSHYDESCTTTCQRCVGGRCGAGGSGTLVNIPFDPAVHNAMSYYGATCRAPFSIDGQLYRPFSDDQNAEIHTCLSTWQRRSELVDVCADRGGDFDRDGICQFDDNCPQSANTAQRDRDFDGRGDVCDLCPDNPASTGDIDGDGIGDICDPDRDDDGCLNADDQNPDDAMVAVGSGIVIGPCENGGFTLYGFEGDDSDNDGFLNCEDVDDDNDGTCDENQASNDASAPPDGCSAGPDDCPVDANDFCIDFEVGPDCVDPFFECLGSGCFEFFAFWEELINPNPANSMRFDNIQLFNQSMYASAPAGMTAASAAQLMSGQALLGRGPVQQYRLSLWRQAGPNP